VRAIQTGLELDQTREAIEQALSNPPARISCCWFETGQYGSIYNTEIIVRANL
jgi:hypothetical protein